MTVSNGWSFKWVENEETIAFFKFISPLLKLPTRQKLGDIILKKTADENQKNIEKIASEDEMGVTISLDSWKNVVKQNILGLVVTRSDGQVLIWGAKDISGDRATTSEAIKQIDQFLNETRLKNIIINAVVTDSASSYNAAREIFILSLSLYNFF